LWIVVVAFAFALFMPAFIISTTAGKQELEKGQARDVGETHDHGQFLTCSDKSASIELTT